MKKRAVSPALAIFLLALLLSPGALAGYLSSDGKAAAVQEISATDKPTLVDTVRLDGTGELVPASAEEGGSKAFAISAGRNCGDAAMPVDGGSAGVVDGDAVQNVTVSRTSRAEFSEQAALPYYLGGDGIPIFIGFSAEVGGTMRYLAPPGEKILFRENPKSFSDVETCWAKSGIAFVAQREILTGTGGDAFSPDMGMTRAMFITVIGKLYERSYGAISALPDAQPFSDTDSGAGYGIYLSWAARNRIVTGIGGGLYEPERTLTRQELAAILYRFAVFLQAVPEERGITEPGYLDADQIGDWAASGVVYGRDAGVLIGRADGRFDPGGIAARAEIAMSLRRFIDTAVK